MSSIDFDIRTRIVFQPGAVGRLGELAASLVPDRGAGRRALVVSDPGVVATGHPDRAQASLAEAGFEVTLFDGVKENPSTDDVEHGAAIAREVRPDLIVGFGGGSSMDCAKGINFLYAGGGRMQDYWGVGKARGTLVPMIAVPTTAGTGSETQSFALISDAQTHVKMACGDKQAACRIALLDPELTLTQPRQVTALTGIDALSHAIETAVTTRRNVFSDAFARSALQRLWNGFPDVLSQPENLRARGEMLLGAALAGLAIENSMLGAAHALANPLTAHFGITHGQAVGVMLPHVIRHNAVVAEADYAHLLREVAGRDCTEAGPFVASHDEANSRDSGGLASDRLADGVTTRLEQADLATRLEPLGVAWDRIETLADEATRQWTGTFNPVPMTAASFAALYRAAF